MKYVSSLQLFISLRNTLQALSAIPTTDDVARECLHKLQAICSCRATLPSSYIVSGKITGVGDGPIVPGGTADVWEGTYRGKNVSIKPPKVPLNDDQTLKKVGIGYCASLPPLLKNACGHYSHSSKRPLYGKG